MTFVQHEICIVRHLTDTQHRLQRAMFLMRALVVLVLVPCAVAQSTSTPSWDVKPSNQVQSLGLNVSLECKVYNASGRKMTWMKVQSPDPSLLFINDEIYQAPSRYGVTFGVQNVSTALTLHLTSVQMDDDATYQCSVQGVQLLAVANVTILVSPGIPTISLNTREEDLKEDTVIQFNCSSTGGNPPPTITWYRNGEVQPNTSSSIVLPAVKFGTTSSILTWRLTREDFRANFSCTAENKYIQGSLVENSTSILVKYAPVISLGSFNPLIVVDNSLMKLNCSISAYPEVDPTTVQWYRNNGSLIGNGTSLTLSSVTVEDAGVYTCSAKNFAVRSANITVDVQYPPKAEPDFREVAVKKGSSVNLTVAFSANPSVNLSNLKSFNGNSFVQSGSFLFIQDVKRSDAGNYTWEATNTLTPSQGTRSQGVGQAMIRLRVLYKPGQASIQVPGTLVMGQNASLTCSVDDQGDPAADLVWFRVGRNDTYPNGTVLRIVRAQFSDIGNYSCVPKNEAGSGQSDVRLLDITELASWIQRTLPNGINASVNGTIDGVTCQARGRPAPTVSWYKDGQLISPTSAWYSVNQESHMLDEYSWNTTSTLKWIGTSRRPNSNSLRPEDAGSYTCQASLPSVGTPVNQTTTVNILYSPRMESSVGTMGFDAGATAVLVCHSQAFPPPTFIWSRGTSQLKDDGKYLVRNVMTSGASSFPYQSELNINGFSILDTGNYTCQATNEVGSSAISFNVTMNSKPSSPTQLRVVSYTWGSIELEWKEGFDGGCPQQFLIETQQTLPVSAGNSTRYNLTGLYPNATYIITVRAENRLGRGNSSNSVSQITDAFTLEMPFDVQYHTPSRTLTCVVSKSDNICIKLLVLKASNNMYNFSKCDLPLDGKAEIKFDELAMQDGEIQTVKASVCLQQRMDVCSGNQTAQFVNDLPVQMIIIICCVCGGFIVILLITIIIVCCCCRKKTRESYSEEQHAISAYETSTTLTPNGTKNADAAQYMDGIDNPALHHPAIGYGKNGAFLNLDYIYSLDRSDSHGSYGSDSGVSVSDVPKTKRIIHEVIV